jgi:hypothetical protein
LSVLCKNFCVFKDFSGAISCSSLYLFLLKESKKRMPLRSGLGNLINNNNSSFKKLIFSKASSLPKAGSFKKKLCPNLIKHFLKFATVIIKVSV